MAYTHVTLVKSIARKLLLPKVQVPKLVNELQEKIGSSFVSERSFYYGKQRRRVKAIIMEAAPGTVEMIMSLIADLPQQTTILDYGCGEHKSGYLKILGHSVYSCDIVPFSLENYTQIDPRNPRLPFADKSYDVTVISEVVEHVEDPWHLLKELIRVTKDRIIISTPNVTSIKSKEVFRNTNFLHWFTPADAAYHITPVFYWQVERFCEREGVVLERICGNHEAFGLNGTPIEYAESLIFVIKV